MRLRRSLALFTWLCAVLFVPAFGAEGDPAKPAEQYYKNIKVFTGRPSDEVFPAMKFMTASLGVNCSYCHVTNNTGHWPMEADDKQPKQTAREMMRMVRQINEQNFGGRVVVTCASCHHGQAHPAASPDLLTPEALKASADDQPAATKPVVPAAPPTVAQLLNHYAEALGGRDKVMALKSRRFAGTLVSSTGEKMPVEVVQAPPFSVRGEFKSKTPVLQGFDGKDSWTSRGDGPAQDTGEDPDQLMVATDFYRQLEPERYLHDLKVTGEEPVHGKRAWVIAGTTDRRSRVKLYFDAESGLLLRVWEGLYTVLGYIPEVFEYSDYRDVGGVKEPYQVDRARAAVFVRRQMQSMEHDVPVESGMFERKKKAEGSSQ
jgi:hypothetical protein